VDFPRPNITCIFNIFPEHFLHLPLVEHVQVQPQTHTIGQTNKATAENITQSQLADEPTNGLLSL